MTNVLAPYMHWAKTRPVTEFDLAASNMLACSMEDLPGGRDAIAGSQPKPGEQGVGRVSWILWTREPSESSYGVVRKDVGVAVAAKFHCKVGDKGLRGYAGFRGADLEVTDVTRKNELTL